MENVLTFSFPVGASAFEFLDAMSERAAEAKLSLLARCSDIFCTAFVQSSLPFCLKTIFTSYNNFKSPHGYVLQFKNN